MEKRTVIRFRKRLSLVIALVITTVVTFFLYTESRLLPSQVAGYINKNYLADTPFEFACDRISGDYFRRVVFHGPVLRYHGASASFNVFRADEISIVYRLGDVFRLNLVVDELTLSDVYLQIRTDEDGMLVLPVPKFDQHAPSSTVSPSVDVKHFAVSGLHLFFGGGARELAVSDVDLSGALEYSDGVGRLRVDYGKAYMSDTGTAATAIHLDVAYEDESIVMRDFGVRLDQSSVSATGAYRDGRFDQVQIIFNPIVLSELHVLGLIPDLDGDFGGSVVVNGSLDTLGVEGTVTGSGFGIGVKAMSFEGVVVDGVLTLPKIDGDVYGARVAGAFTYQFGSGDFVFDGECANLDISRGFVPDEDLPSMNANGHLHVEYTSAQENFEIVAALDSFSIAGYMSYHTEFHGRYSPVAGFVVDDGYVERPGYSVRGSGSIKPDGQVEFVGSGAGTDLTYLFESLSLPQMGGQVVVTGRVTGRIDDIRINFNGDVTNVTYLGTTVDSGSVQAELLGVGGDNPNITLVLDGKRLTLGKLEFEKPHLFLTADTAGVAIQDLSFWYGDTSVGMAFDARGDPEVRTDIHLRRFFISGATDTWTMDQPAVIRLSEGEVSVDSVVISSLRGVFGVSGDYSENDRVCNIRVWGNGVDLRLISDASGTPVDVRGQGRFFATAIGDIDRPDVTAFLEVKAGRIDSLEFDNLEINVRSDPTGLTLERCLLVRASDSLFVKGTWGVPITRNLLDEPSSDVLLDATLDVAMDSRHFPLTDFLLMLGKVSPVRGALSGSVSVTGSAREPVIALSGSITPRDGSPITMVPATVSVTYRDRRLEIAEIRLHGGLNTSITGSIPLRVPALGDTAAMDNEPVDLEVVVSHGSLASVANYIEAVAQLDGRIDGRVTIRGTVSDPSWGGQLRIDKARVSFAGMAEAFAALDARIELSDNVVRLVSLDARSGKDGALFASGFLELDGLRPARYRVDARLRDFTVKSVPDVDAVLNGELVIEPVEIGGRRVPNITGALTVASATIRRDLATDDHTTSTAVMPTTSPGWVCTVDLVGYNNIWMRTPDLTVELGGRVIVVRDLSGLYFRGDVNILRGSYLVYGNKFRILDGSLNFSTAVRPDIQINAYTPHRTDGGVERRIYLSLSWRQPDIEPTITLSYDEPGYYEEDLWRMLGGASIGAGLATNALERILNQQMGGVSIEIDRRGTGFSNAGSTAQETTIGVGKYLWENLYLRYRQGLTLSTERQLQIEYRLTNLLLLRSEFIRNSTKTTETRGTSPDEFNIDVKLRWEY